VAKVDCPHFKANCRPIRRLIRQGSGDAVAVHILSRHLDHCWSCYLYQYAWRWIRLIVAALAVLALSIIILLLRPRKLTLTKIKEALTSEATAPIVAGALDRLTPQECADLSPWLSGMMAKEISAEHRGFLFCVKAFTQRHIPAGESAFFQSLANWKRSEQKPMCFRSVWRETGNEPDSDVRFKLRIQIIEMASDEFLLYSAECAERHFDGESPTAIRWLREITRRRIGTPLARQVHKILINCRNLMDK
jgi:hypothetical protein